MTYDETSYGSIRLGGKVTPRKISPPPPHRNNIGQGRCIMFNSEILVLEETKVQEHPQAPWCDVEERCSGVLPKIVQVRQGTYLPPKEGGEMSRYTAYVRMTVAPPTTSL